MKILFVHSGSDLYGASRSLLRLSIRLTKDGNTIIVVIPYDGPLRKKLEENGIYVIIHRELSIITRKRFYNIIGMLIMLIYLPISIIKLWFVVRNFRPDIIHTNTAVILTPGIVAKFKKVPHVWHIRESFCEFPGLWKYYQWYIYTLSDAIICVSASVASQFAAHIQTNKVIVIYNGYPESEFKSIEKEKIQFFRKRFGLNNSLTVGVAGRIKLGRKGQDIFVKAAALLKDRFPDVKFVLIGSPFPGNEKHLYELMELIKKLGLENQVVYTGDIENIEIIYSILDIVVLSSVFPEPLSNVLIESMAFGKPVIGTKLGGSVEIIEDKVNGLLVEPKPESLANALELLLSDPKLRQVMGKNGKKRFLSTFEIEQSYKKIKSVYINLAKNN